VAGPTTTLQQEAALEASDQVRTVAGLVAVACLGMVVLDTVREAKAEAVPEEAAAVRAAGRAMVTREVVAAVWETTTTIREAEAVNMVSRCLCVRYADLGRTGTPFGATSSCAGSVPARVCFQQSRSCLFLSSMGISASTNLCLFQVNHISSS